MDLPKKPPTIISGVTKVSYGEPDHKLGYKHSSRCLICVGKDREGSPIRDAFDEFALKSTNKECNLWLMEHGIVSSERAVDNHITRHAPYISIARTNGSSKVQKMIVKIRQEKTEVSTALQRIIDIGDSKVQDGTMPVTEKLYVEALKEQGRRGVKTTMDTEFETMDEGFVNKIKQLNNGETT